MKITLYKFNKRENSTALPYSSVPSKEVKVQVYGDISLMTPTFVLEGASGSSSFTNYVGYTYCYVPDWKRRYFIDDIVISKGQILLKMSIDLLGTYKYSITSGTAYIRRADTTVTTEPDQLHLTGETLSAKGSENNLFPDNMSYIVGIRGKNTGIYTSMGNVTYYNMTQNQLNSLCSKLWASTTYTEKRGDYLVSCRPILGSFSGSDYRAVWIGNESAGFSSDTLDFSSPNCKYESPVYRITVPKHPQWTTGYDWLNSSEYASYSLYAGVFGTISIPASMVQSSSYMGYKLRINPLNGEATLFILDSNDNVQMRLTQSVFGTVPISAQSSNFSSTMAKELINITEGLVNAAQSKGVDLSPYTQIIDAYVSKNGINFKGLTVGGTSTISSTGGGGSITCADDKISLSGFFKEIRDVVPSTEGRAINKSDSISNYSGMVEMTMPQISPTRATENEKNALYRMCNGVIYIE